MQISAGVFAADQPKCAEMFALAVRAWVEVRPLTATSHPCASSTNRCTARAGGRDKEDGVRASDYHDVQRGGAHPLSTRAPIVAKPHLRTHACVQEIASIVAALNATKAMNRDEVEAAVSRVSTTFP